MRTTIESEGVATAIEPHAPPHVRDALAGLGRTEDVKFSPDNRRLALAGFSAKACMLFDIRLERHGRGRRLFIDDFAELRSDHFHDPHGFDFIGNRVLVVANRAGAVTLFDMPPPWSGGRTFDVRPFRVIDQADDAGEPLRTPGSVCVSRTGLWCHELLVCDTYMHRVTWHAVNTRHPTGWQGNAVGLESGLDIPDGVTVSPDGGTVAVSNHRGNEVLLFDRRRMSRTAEPVARLTGMDYPHGLRFSPDGRHLYTADAGRPFVFRHRRPAGGWHGTVQPVGAARVLSEEVFQRGRVNPEEGGPKGLDLTRDGSLLAITCEQQPLAVFAEHVLFG